MTSASTPFERIVLLDRGFGADRPFQDMAKVVIPYHSGLHLRQGDLMIFEGGTDINPRLYGAKPHPATQRSDHKRDLLECQAFGNAKKNNIPMLGICRGAQLITALVGGKLIQDINGHHHSHLVATGDGKRFMVTSLHHQMMYPWNLPGDDFDILAWTTKQSTRFEGEEFGKNMPFPADAFGPDILEKDFDNCKQYITEPEVIWYGKIGALAIQGHPEYSSMEDPFVQYCRHLVSKILTVRAGRA